MSLNLTEKKYRLTKLLLGFFLVLSFSNCSRENENNDWNTESLKGRVQSYSELSYKIIKEKKQEKNFKKIIKSYNKSGKIDEEFLYEFDGTGSRFVPKYNEKGKKIEMYCYATYSGNLLYKWIYKYDNLQNKIKDEIFDSSNKLTIERFFKYDEKGNKIESTEHYVYNPKNTVKRKTHEYNVNGKTIRTNIYDPFGVKLERYYTFIYDNYGNKIEENIFDPNGNLNSKWTYKYEFDEKNNWIKKTEFDKGLFPKYILEREYQYY